MAVANVVAKFTADISDVQAKMGALKKSFAEAGDSSQQLSQRFKTVGAEMSRVGKGMTIGLTLPLAAVGAAAVKASVDFESSMSKIVGLVGIAANEVEAMKAEVIAMSGETAKSPVELANALFVVTSAGLRGAEAMETLDMSARAGAAGLGETSDIARAVAGALSAYGSEVLSASDATDQIVATARAGNFETSQFAAAIGRVLPFAQQAGATFADMGGAVALLTRVNGDAAQSVTQMAALFRAFVVPTEEAKKGLQDVGLSAQQLRDSIAKQGLPATLQMLDKALGGNREQLGRILGSSEAASAAFQILGADSKVLSETFGVVADSAGMTDEAFDAAANTAGFKMQQAMVSLQGTLIQIGDIIVPLVTEIAKFAKTLLDGFQSLPGPMKTVIVAFGGVVAVLGPILFIGGKVIAMFGAMAAAFVAAQVKIGIAIGAMRASFAAMVISIKTAMIGARTQFGALVAGIRAGAASASAAIKSMAIAMKGALISTGIGAVLVGIAIALEAFMSAQADATQHVENLTDAMVEQNNVMGESVARELAKSMQEIGSAMAGDTGFVDDLALLGLTLEDAVNAAMRGGPAMDDFANRVRLAAGDSRELSNAAGGVIAVVKSQNEAVGEATAKYDALGVAEKVAADVARELAGETTGLTSATVQSAIAVGNAITANDGYAASLDGVTNAAGETITELDFMKQEMADFLAVTGQISTVDAAAASIDSLGKAAVDFGTDLMGRTPEARDFRAEVVSAFNDSGKAAASLSDDIPTQRAIFTGELIKIVAALRASGVKPKDIEAFLGAMDDLPASVSDIMRSAAKAVGDTDFKTEIEKAFKKSVKAGAPMTADTMEELSKGASKAAKDQLGLTLEPELASIIKSGTTALRPTAFNNGVLTGKSIGSGAAFGINQSSPIVQAAVARVMAQAKAAADAAVEADSPSKLFARTGDDIGAGVAVGITRSGGKVTEAVTKLARSLTTAFVSALQGDSGSVAAAINEVFGSIPTVKTPLEDALGVKGAEKFIKNNKKALTELLSVAEQIDVIMDKLQSAGQAAATLASLTAKPFGRPSEIAKMFGSSSDLDSVIDGYLNLRQVVKDAYAVLTDPDIVGGKAAARNRAALRATQKELRALATEAVNLHKAYEANAQAIVDLDKAYGEEVKGINDAYDVLDKAAAASIQSIEDRWSNTIPGLETALRDTTAAFDKENAVLQRLISERDQFLDGIRSGFRSFVNNLSFESRAATKAIMRETKTLADGVTVTLEREIEAGGGPASIRASLQERLDAVREFSRNIRTLMERGLDPSLVRDFVSAGVSGAGDAAAALASGSQEDLAAINTIQSELLSEADGFASYASAQWHDIAIAQREAIVGPLEVAKDMAEAALKLANTTRDSELKAAREHADQLKKDRRDDLKESEDIYNKERDRLLAEGIRLQGEMDIVAAKIQAIIARVAGETAQASAKAANRAAQNLITEFEKSYPGVAKKLGKLMDALAASMNRTAQIVVRTVYEAGNPLPRRAMGGPVRASTAYLVGERGPEVFVPNFSGNIIPNMGSVPSMGPRSVSANGGGSTYQITVNAGVGDPREIGRVTVEAIQAYERSNGRVFASA